MHLHTHCYRFKHIKEVAWKKKRGLRRTHCTPTLTEYDYLIKVPCVCYDNIDIQHRTTKNINEYKNK